MTTKYPQPHRKMYLAWKRGTGINLSHADLRRLFLDDAMMMAATQQNAAPTNWARPAAGKEPAQ